MTRRRTRRHLAFAAFLAVAVALLGSWLGAGRASCADSQCAKGDADSSPIGRQAESLAGEDAEDEGDPEAMIVVAASLATTNWAIELPNIADARARPSRRASAHHARGPPARVLG